MVLGSTVVELFGVVGDKGGLSAAFQTLSKAESRVGTVTKVNTGRQVELLKKPAKGKTGSTIRTGSQLDRADLL